ncbi:hypothetical protein HK098_004154 [Nowakowskiella sp. JEL0407]|nr:hypothetical protein HK098_004154 [Nowakowskiella sp. JEL0407]
MESNASELNPTARSHSEVNLRRLENASTSSGRNLIHSRARSSVHLNHAMRSHSDLDFGKYYEKMRGSRDSIHSTSGYSTGSAVNEAAMRYVENKYQLMVERLYNRCIAEGMVSLDDPFGFCSVAIKDHNGNFLVYPDDKDPSPFIDAIVAFDVQAAIFLRNRSIRSGLALLPATAKYMKMPDGGKLQVFESLDYLSRARKHQWASLLQSENALICWSEHIEDILDVVRNIERQIFEVVWSGPIAIDVDLNKEVKPSVDSENKDENIKDVDSQVEVESIYPVHKRKYVFITGFITAVAVAFTLFVFGLGVSELVVASVTDGNWQRMATLVIFPMEIVFFLFVPFVTISAILQTFGPINQLFANTVYYSGSPPERLVKEKLPHVTIQIAVYTESLDTVIHPTIKSVKQAMTTYERQGGSVNIYINDDGMQVIPPDEAQKRKDYYKSHSIGWCSRPKHNKDGFIRKGRFKKASNLNFCLRVSTQVEKLMMGGMDYEDAIKEVTSDGIAWCGGNILLGDYILQLDADTRVPEDSIIDAVSEMVQSPEVGIIQFTSGVMYVVRNFWENGIGHFTDLVYASIQFVCGSGEVAPFVGHNAILRWSAMEEVAFEEDGVIKYWSESHVSEDFDMSLRMQIRGYVIRYSTYTGDGFQEGVSLTVYDEINRWQKYAYGCSELVFNPLKYWLIRGPFTRLFRRFLFSDMNLSSKINIVGYIGSYYAIGAAWPLTLINYFLVGYFSDFLDFKAYLISYNVFLSSIMVFTVVSTISYTVYNYRLKKMSLAGGFLRNVMWIPFFSVFFSGLSFHVSMALIAHLVGYNMTWSTTSKELEASNFFKEAPKVLKGYKIMYVIFLCLTLMLPIISFIPPPEWQIRDFTTILPAAFVFGGHLLLPIVLNPALMTFTY